MNEFKIVLDENSGTYVTIPEASRKVWLEVSDDLEISEFATNLPNSYQTKIHQLLEKSGHQVVSLARLERFENGKVIFKEADI